MSTSDDKISTLDDKKSTIVELNELIKIILDIIMMPNNTPLSETQITTLNQTLSIFVQKINEMITSIDNNIGIVLFDLTNVTNDKEIDDKPAIFVIIKGILYISNTSDDNKTKWSENKNRLAIAKLNNDNRFEPYNYSNTLVAPEQKGGSGKKQRKTKKYNKKQGKTIKHKKINNLTWKN